MSMMFLRDDSLRTRETNPCIVIVEVHTRTHTTAKQSANSSVTVSALTTRKDSYSLSGRLVLAWIRPLFGSQLPVHADRTIHAAPSDESAMLCRPTHARVDTIVVVDSASAAPSAVLNFKLSIDRQHNHHSFRINFDELKLLHMY